MPKFAVIEKDPGATFVSVYRVRKNAAPATGLILVDVSQDLADEFETTERLYRELCGKIAALALNKRRST